MAEQTTDNAYRNIPGTRIRYVEPNYTNSIETIGLHGRHNNEFENNLEEYCTFINLCVEVRGRTININESENGKEYIVTWQSQQGKDTVSFLQGTTVEGINKTSNILTTDYTNTFIDDIVTNDNGKVNTKPSTELFGIESIDIEYNNMMVPQVTIKFVDVRGAAIFALEEAARTVEHNGVGGYSNPDITGSFFKSFFTMPYPKFTLVVKGYYGQPVSYTLTVQDFRTSFRSTTGNFDVTVKFIGFQFSFLGDVMVNALTAAPYSDWIGRDYWKSQVDNGRFSVTDGNGNDVPMMTMGELYNKIKSLEEDDKALKNSSPKVEEKRKLENESQSINGVVNAYNTYTTNLINALSEFEDVKTYSFNDNNSNVKLSMKHTDNTNGYVRGVCVIVSDSDKDKTFSEIVGSSKAKSVQDSFNSLSKEFESYKSNNGGKSIIFNIRDITNSKPSLLFSKTQDGRAKFTFDSSGNILTDYPSIRDWADKNVNAVNDAFGKTNIDAKAAMKYVNGNIIESAGIHYGYIITDGGTSDSFSKAKQENDTNIAKNQTEIDEAAKKEMVIILGFVPNIRNITKIIMAHFETLVHMIRETGISIESQNPKRTPSSLGMDNSNLPDFVGSGNNSVPPFPKVVSRSTNSDGSNILEEAWVGDFSGDWLEKDLVYGILNGITEVANIITEANNSASSGSSESLIKTPMKIPLTPMDFIIDKRPYSPSIDFNNVSDFAGQVGIRMLQIFGLTDAIDLESQVNSIAKAEARNFSILFKNPSSEFLSKLNDDNGNFGDTIFDVITNGESGGYARTYGKNGRFAWSNPRSKYVIGLTTRKFKLQCFNSSLIDSNNGYYLPVQNTSFSQLNSELSPNSQFYNKPRTMDNYICTKCSIGKDNTGETADNLLVITDKPHIYKSIIEQNVKDDNNDGLSELNRMLLSEFDYSDGDAYKKCFNNTDEIFDLMSGNIPITKTGSDGKKAKDYHPGIFPNERRTEKEAIEDSLFYGGVDLEGDLDYSDSNGFDDNDIDAPNENESFWSDFDSSKCSLHIIPGIRERGLSNIFGAKNGNSSLSLFGEKGYYAYDDYHHRAFLFLLSLSRYVDYEYCFGMIDSKRHCCVFMPKAVVLMAGAYFWMETKGNSLPSGEGKLKVDIDVLNGRFGLPKNLRQDVKNVFIKSFVNWVSGTYRPIICENGLEINFKNGYEDFFSKVLASDFAMKDTVVNSTKTLNVEAFFINNTVGDSFFKNYFTVNCDVTRSTNGDSDSGILLGMRDNSNAAIESTRTCLDMRAVIIPTRYITTDVSGVISMDASRARTFLRAFTEELKVLYKDKSESNNTNQKSIDRAAEPDTNIEIKIAVYRYLKLIYDKWIAGDTMNNSYTMEYFFGGNNPVFIFIDAFYHKIGEEFLINVSHFAEQIESCQQSSQYTLLTFLSMICKENKFNFFCINNFLDLSDEYSLKSMFKPVSYMDMQKPSSHPNFIIQYPYEPSSHLDLGDDYQFKDDSFTITSTTNKMNLPMVLQDGDGAGYSIPAFGVSYGKLYQSYFIDVDVNMDSPITTEQAIKAHYQIASMNNENQKGTEKNIVTMGQDLYTIYSNNSYTCKVRMLGCAWVQPLMYFCLTNVPMFKGTYYIIKVTHHVERGNMITEFTGVRMANNCTRRTRDWYIRKSPTNNGSNGASDIERREALANFDNDCPYKVYPLYGGEIGGGIPIEDLNSTVKEVCAKYGIKYATEPSSYMKSKGYSFDKRMPDAKLIDALTAMCRQEIPDYEGLLSQKIWCTTVCNWWHGNSKSKIFSSKGLSFCYASLDNNNGFSNVENVKRVFIDGPASLIGEMTEPSNKVRIVKNGQQTNTKSSSVKLDYDMLSRVYLYCTDCGYDHSILGKENGCGGSAKNYESGYGKPDFLWWKGDYLFHHKHTVYITNPDTSSDKHYWQMNVKTKNDNSDGEKNKLTKAFANAVINTVRSSSIGGNIGYDEKTITENTLEFSCDDRSKLQGVFDVCLNAYCKYVEELKWIIGDGESMESYPYRVFVKVADTATISIVGMFSRSGNSYGTPEDNLNVAYIKSIYKFKNSSNGTSYERVVVTKPTDEQFSRNALNNCNNLANQNGTVNYGGGGVVDSNRMIGNWNAGKAASYAASKALSKSKGWCARYTMNAVAYGGVTRFSASHADWLHTDNILSSKGWAIVSEGTTRDSFNSGSQSLQIGDLCVQSVYEGKSPSNARGGYHICIYDGNGTWYSDFKQPQCIVYKNCKHWWLYRYSGKGM